MDWPTRNEHQKAVMDLVDEGLSGNEIARRLGKDGGTVRKTIRKIKSRAASKGIGPSFLQAEPVSEIEIVKGTSTLYGADGKPKLQWVKTRADDEKREEMFQSMLEAMKEEIPRATPVPSPNGTQEDLVSVYVLSDFHLGMLAWHEEAGDDWDLEIAQNLLLRWFDEVISRTPDSKTALFLELGDYLHFDSLAPVTPTSGHLVDADTRFAKLVRVMIRATRMVIEKLRTKHERVIVLMAEGNHDLASSVAMREWLSAMYEHEPRVEVDTSPKPYYCHVFGEVMVAAHHGHLKKNSALPLSLAAMFPQEWGTTRFRYAHTGHRHHREVKEHNGIIVEQHPTLAARDAYANRLGFTNQRAAHAITYHQRFGEIGRVTLGPEAVL